MISTLCQACTVAVQYGYGVAPVRQNLKLGARTAAPGARTERVRAPSPWCGRVVISKP